MQPHHVQPPPRTFDPRTGSPEERSVDHITPDLILEEKDRLSTIGRLVDSLTEDPRYRILFEELFKHLILLPPLLLMSVLLHLTSAYLGPPHSFFAHTEHVLIQCISLFLILFAFCTVALTLIDAGFLIMKSSDVITQLRQWWRKRKPNK